MRWVRAATAVIALAALLTACAGALSEPPTSAEASPDRTTRATETDGRPQIIGVWTRTQDCDAQLGAFEAAGLAESQLAWVTGNWLPEGVVPDPADPCAGARPPEEHSHFFTAAGAFGSYDAVGNQVDNGDYVLVDDDTLSFASHAQELGYDGDVIVDFVLDGDLATFAVRMPPDCAGGCAKAYAWAYSAFYEADPWARQPPASTSS